MTEVTSDENAQFTLLRKEVKQDIELAIANFKIWLLLAVLSNVVLIGLPALYVFFSTTNTAQTALTMALEDRKRLEERLPWITSTDARLTAIERHLTDKSGFQPPGAISVPR